MKLRPDVWPLRVGAVIEGRTILRDPMTGREYLVERVIRPERIGEFYARPKVRAIEPERSAV